MRYDKRTMGNAVMSILTYCEELANNGLSENLSEIQSAIDTAKGIATMYELREIEKVNWLIGYINYEAKDQGLWVGWYNHPLPIKVTFHIGKDVDIMMTKQALLENVLDMWLTQKQIDAIENSWNAFYNNPMQYKNSVVVDMVKLFLQEV